MWGKRGKGPPCKIPKMPIFFLQFALFYAWLKLSSDFFLAPSVHLMTEYNFFPQIVKMSGNLMFLSGSAGCVKAEGFFKLKGVWGRSPQPLVKGPFFVKKGPFSNICPSSENP